MPLVETEQFLSRVVLGTVQWGMDYGISNQRGMPSDEELGAMLAEAYQHGVRTLDTARAYGQSEKRIGALLDGSPGWRVITKLSPDLGKYGEEPDDIVKAAAESLAESHANLNRPCLDGVLLHRAVQLRLAGGAVWQYLLAQQDAGVIRQLGVSAMTPEEALLALDEPGVRLIQVASSLFDQRLVQLGFFKRAKEQGVEVFIRSVFLQGVAFMHVSELPEFLEPLARPLASIRSWAEARELTVGEALVRYIAGHGAQLVVGCETQKQLSALLQAARKGAFDAEEMQELEQLVPLLPDAVLDPWRWQTR